MVISCRPPAETILGNIGIVEPRVVVVESRPEWAGEFQSLGAALRRELGELAERIDHIGSTSVAGLAAKDVIDVQITTADLDAASVDLVAAIERTGACQQVGVGRDHCPPGSSLPAIQLDKLLFCAHAPYRRSNIHVRVAGRFNQRYALLCRDYLRSHPGTAAAYGEVKRELARHFPNDLDSYYAVKDPAFDLFMSGADEWATWTGWSPGPSDA
jgi:GrpB-like predicted nucleotidyltransferase (UPF0157 family)